MTAKRDTSAWTWMSLSILSATTSAFESVSQRVPRSALQSSVAAFETMSTRVFPAFTAQQAMAAFTPGIKTPKIQAPARSPRVEAPISAPPAGAPIRTKPAGPPIRTPPVGVPISTQSAGAPAPPIVPVFTSTVRKRDDGTKFISKITEACTGLFERVIPSPNPEPFVTVTRRKRQRCKRPRCVPVVILERDHVVIIESG